MINNVYTVGQINSYIRNMFAQDFLLSRIQVSGEVSNCKYHSSGHIYFTLKDETGILNAVMFAGSRKTGLKFPMRSGDKVVVSGEIRVYERDGKYQLYAERIALQGEGMLYRRYEELKARLEEMGMFAAEYKRPIPKYARTIGIVTAPTGSVIRDIQNVARRRNPYVQLILYPAKVQGEGAALSIVNGMRALDRRGVDIIIIGRGGGSIEDLWAFNEEAVAEAIFDCTVPVISAVGHETDTTIADFVADLRVPTPSAAAEIAVFDIRQVIERIEAYNLTLMQLMSRRIEQLRSDTDRYKLRLMMLDPKSRLIQQRQRALDMDIYMTSRMEQIVTEYRHRLQICAVALDAASPLKKMEGGYAFIVKDDKKRLAGVSDLHEGSRVEAYMTDGSFTAVVERVCKAGGYLSGGGRAKDERAQKAE